MSTKAAINESLSPKDAILKNEANARSLGKTIVAYSRRGEEDDTLIVRDLSKRTTFDHFGVKGLTDLERLFYTILGVLNAQRAALVKRARFGEGDDLRKLLDGISDDDREKMQYALDATRNDDDEGVNRRSDTRVQLTKIDTCPQLELVRFTDDQLKFGVYLFMHGTIKLVRHMNTTFALSKSESLLFTAKQPLDKYTSDNFF